MTVAQFAFWYVMAFIGASIAVHMDFEGDNLIPTFVYVVFGVIFLPLIIPMCLISKAIEDRRDDE